MAEFTGPPDPPLGPPDPLENAWVLKALRTLIAGLNSPDVAAADVWRQVEGKAAEVSAEIGEQVSMWTGVSNNPPDEIGTYIKLGAEIIQYLVEQVTGLNVPGGTVSAVMGSQSAEVTRLSLGNIFVTLLDETLRLDGVREGFLARDTGTAEGANMARMVGAAFRMQLGDMVAGWAAKAVPFGLGDGLTQIAERIDKAINLDDAIEEIIQVPMQAVITRGLEQYYNRQLKPADLTANEARQAKILGKITDDQYARILDNLGYRDDIRGFLLDQTYANLTESDINDGYQWNLLSREQVKEHYRQKLFNEQDQETKTKLVEMTRRQKLREKIFELYGNLYRDGVATKQEVTPFLQNYGYDNDEIEMWFSVQELERRQRKWISDGNLLKLIVNGERTTTEAIQYLVLQGMEVNDATAFISLAVKQEVEAEAASIEREVKAVVNRLPKAIKDQCDDVFSPEKILGELLTRAIALIPLGGANLTGLADLRKIIECALKGLGVTPPATP